MGKKKKEGRFARWWKRFLEKMAKANEEQFGKDKVPDCCDKDLKKK